MGGKLCKLTKSDTLTHASDTPVHEVVRAIHPPEDKTEPPLPYLSLISTMLLSHPFIPPASSRHDARRLAYLNLACPVCTMSLTLFPPLLPTGQDTRIRFSVAPLPGDSGFRQWHDAMMMCARLPGGIPQEFRRRWIVKRGRCSHL
ncbi:TBC1 domain family member 30 [Portunus trituberculatus]|uniref:TBC1 domain family member 30 n=1 Tax=Portunus trituberculatus TaxID=210409 RepID=A0A5B7FD53_PORTR|nr:TBC1 domain family member 30 [Portunus trituberculatus]